MVGEEVGGGVSVGGTVGVWVAVGRGVGVEVGGGEGVLVGVGRGEFIQGVRVGVAVGVKEGRGVFTTKMTRISASLRLEETAAMLWPDAAPAKTIPAIPRPAATNNARPSPYNKFTLDIFMTS
jgi:hypothetical protein